MYQSLVLFLKRILNIILDILFPRTCPVCQKIVGDRGEKICRKCRPKLVYIKEPICKKCGKQLDSMIMEYCYDCNKKPHVFDRGVSCFAYKNEIKNSIYQYKYNNKREYAEFYTEEMVKTQGEQLLRWNPDVVIPIPLHKKRKKRRGFNQSELLAKGIAEYLNIPTAFSYIKRTTNTKPLKELNDKERKESLVHAFTTKSGSCPWESVLLVDDIYTTGSTVDAISGLLKAKGVKKVYVLTLCIGKGY